jgi:DUF4097 and DUF4098 domain-containing protein YvlB
MKEFRFLTSGTPSISLRLPSGEVRIVQGEPGEVVVQMDGRSSTVDRFIVEDRGSEIVIEPERSSSGRWSSVDITIRVGEPAKFRGRLVSADLTAGVRLASVHVESASGDINVVDVDGDATVRAASGDIRIGSVGGSLDVTSASGDVRAEQVTGSASVKTASGDIQVASADGEFQAKSASGGILVTRFDGLWFDAKSLSGDVNVGVLPGRRFDVAFRTLSGEVRTDFPVGEGQGGDAAPGRLTINTISGDITVTGSR